ncbi:MAG: glucose 1-dehydrogenase [Cyanobacteria bacterium J083]|nr:MAG: glucose 1-dehydrogenase [Cyanobacteria bacterium J083]
MKRLQDRITLVTGSSSGIGAAVAQSMAAEGAKVIVNYARSSKGAEEVVKKIQDEGGKAIAIQADVSQEEQVKSMFQEIFDKFGTIDVLVNNAGIQQDANLVDMSLAQWRKVIDVNLTGQFLCAREAAKEFIRRGVTPEKSCSAGVIICMSSVHEVIPWAGHCNYAASKGGLRLFMQSIAQELASYKIRINSIAPGAIKTPINRSAWETPEAEAQLLKLIPYNRVGVPEDIGKAAVWLASDEAEYVHGTTIFVDGGMTLYPGFATGG